MIIILKFALQKLEFFGFFPILFFRTVMIEIEKYTMMIFLCSEEKFKLKYESYPD